MLCVRRRSSVTDSLLLIPLRPTLPGDLSLGLRSVSGSSVHPAV